MTVYIIQCGEQPFVKIGWAGDIKIRLKGLQGAHFETLHVIREIPGEVHTEKQIQYKFRRYHIRREWYHLHEDMLTFQPEPEPPGPTEEELARADAEMYKIMRRVRIR